MLLLLLHSKKRGKKARNGRFSRFQTSVPWCANFLCTFVCIALANTLTKLFNKNLGIWCHRCSILDVTFSSGLHRELTTIKPVSFNFFFFLYLFWDQPNILVWRHHQASSIKWRRRKERLCSLTRKFWCISGCGKVELH